MGSDWRPWSLVTRLGLTVVLVLVVSLFAGIWLDGVFGTRPLMTLILSMVGMLVATINCYIMVVDSLGKIPKVPRDGADKDSVSGVAHRNGHPETSSGIDESETKNDD